MSFAQARAQAFGCRLLSGALGNAVDRNRQQAADGDDSLILAAAGGDRGAFARLVDRHSARAFAVAYRMTGNRSDAEDVVQEAFIRAWRHADRWQPGRAAFSTWLYRVVTNAAIDQKRRPRHDDLEDVAEPMDETPDAEESLLVRQRNAAIAKASAALPDRQRQALALCYGAGLSNKAAADVIGVSVKALESLLIRAKRALRDDLGGIWGEATGTD
ncbi:MAG: RNA polymerase sigma factor [Alphaproteobacteria bacterium]